MTHSVKRFSKRVKYYNRYRPRYPADILGMLKSKCSFTQKSVVADVGSGTGILSQLFLGHGNPVFGIEPNAEMRVAGERYLANYARFKSVEGTAEATTLNDGSIDVIVAGNAFHWFDRGPTRDEFIRILKPDGWVALIWNERRLDTPFLAQYEQLLLTYGVDYQQVDHRQISMDELGPFFGEGVEHAMFDNEQTLDFEGLKGRLLSTSYVPAEGELDCNAMLDALQSVFQSHARGGKVRVEYVTRVFYGRMK